MMGTLAIVLVSALIGDPDQRYARRSEPTWVILKMTKRYNSLIFRPSSAVQPGVGRARRRPAPRALDYKPFLQGRYASRTGRSAAAERQTRQAGICPTGRAHTFPGEAGFLHLRHSAGRLASGTCAPHTASIPDNACR